LRSAAAAAESPSSKGTIQIFQGGQQIIQGNGRKGLRADKLGLFGLTTLEFTVSRNLGAIDVPFFFFFFFLSFFPPIFPPFISFLLFSSLLSSFRLFRLFSYFALSCSFFTICVILFLFLSSYFI